MSPYFDPSIRNGKPMPHWDEVWNAWVSDPNSYEAPCWCCGDLFIKRNDFQRGHVKAVSYGGSNHVWNLRPICALCNDDMGRENMVDYMVRKNFRPHGKMTCKKGDKSWVMHIQVPYDHYCKATGILQVDMVWVCGIYDRDEHRGTYIKKWMVQPPYECHKCKCMTTPMKLCY